jgi:enoyl-[acyl-carrier protein] reductase I
MLLSGRRGLIVGIANRRSLAYGIAKAARLEGAELAMSYQDERLSAWAQEIAAELEASVLMPCELGRDAEIAALAGRLAEQWGRLDFLVHAVAHAKREELSGRFVDTSRDGFASAMDVSVYSLVALTRALEPLLAKGLGPSVLTLSYFGAEKVVGNYNVMGVAKAGLESAVRYLAADLGPLGIRVNALSPGPVRTLSAKGVSGLHRMLATVEANAPLRRNIGIDEVGSAALFALSDLSRAVTGEVLHVDAGYNILGAPP